MTSPLISFEYELKNFDGEKIIPKYFHGDPRFSLKPKDYQIRPFISGNGYQKPKGILFKPSFTYYALILQASNNGKILDTALIGFDLDDAVIDCLQIQGGAKRYRELTPIKWDNLLLDSVIKVAKEAGLEAICVVPWRKVINTENIDEKTCERLIKRYDENALSHNFKYSKKQNRYVLELKKLGITP